jgi:3-oxoacid CoA-transferase B subunit
MDARMQGIKLRKNAAIAKASDIFNGVRGGHMNLLIVDGFQVSENGDLANIEKGNQVFPSIGTAMDLACGSSPTIVLMEMTEKGKPNLVKNCTYKVSGRKCVSKLITDMGVFDFKPEGLILSEIAKGVTVDHIKSKTPCEFKVASNLKTLDY